MIQYTRFIQCITIGLGKMNTKETKGDGTGAEAALVKARSNHNFDKRYKAARQASTTADRPIAMVESRVASFANLGHNGWWLQSASSA